MGLQVATVVKQADGFAQIENFVAEAVAHADASRTCGERGSCIQTEGSGAGRKCSRGQLRSAAWSFSHSHQGGPHCAMQLLAPGRSQCAETARQFVRGRRQSTQFTRAAHREAAHQRCSAVSDPSPDRTDTSTMRSSIFTTVESRWTRTSLP